MLSDYTALLVKKGAECLATVCTWPQSQLRVVVCMCVCALSVFHCKCRSGCQQAYCVGMLNFLARMDAVSASLPKCVRAESRKSKSTEACCLAGRGSKW